MEKSERILPEEMDRIDAYIAKARPGPWERETRNENHRELAMNVLVSAEGKSIADSLNADHLATNYAADEDGVNYFDEGTLDDFEFCANARTDLPRLTVAYRNALEEVITWKQRAERCPWCGDYSLTIDVYNTEDGLEERCQRKECPSFGEDIAIFGRELLKERDRQQETFTTHTRAVGDFLGEMAEIHSLDVLEPPPATVSEVTAALLRVCREMRERMANERSAASATEMIAELRRMFPEATYLRVQISGSWFGGETKPDTAARIYMNNLEWHGETLADVKEKAHEYSSAR